MHYSKIYPKTRRDDPADVPSPGTRLLVRAGFMTQVASGVWISTPLGLAVRRRVEAIVRQEMQRADAVELELPILQPRSLWEETRRWDKYIASNTAFQAIDRKGAEFLMAPTAEEVITHFARTTLQSFRDLPITFWQMGPKFRDELRPRQGLIRGREFIMKDAYSFGADPTAMKEAYDTMEDAYNRVFTRCGFNYIEVEADSGAIGGSGSAEFMAVTEFGEDILLYCPACHYGGNQEKASAHYPVYPEEALADLVKLPTPNIRTVQELEEFTGIPASKMAKTIVMDADGKPVIVTMRGDLEISEIKLANLLGAKEVATADAETVQAVTGAPVGFAGPINLYGKTNVRYFFDRSVHGLRNFLCGANEEDIHFINVNPDRDFPQITEYHDLSKAVAGQHCPNCKTSQLVEKRGIELGHIFQLQQVYSEPMGACYASELGKKTPYWMGCYGIGVSRIVQAIVEQHNDERGIIWPWSLTPFHIVVIPVNAEKNGADAETIYQQLQSDSDLRVLIDDRDLRIGEKLTDAELIGIPLQVLVGRTWEQEHKLEVRLRDVAAADARFSVSKPGSLPTATMTIDELEAFCRELDERQL